MTLARMAQLFAAVVLACALAPAGAQGQKVYRCGPDGRQFSDQPCAGGQVMDVAQAPRPAEDLADARSRAQREQRQAALLDAQLQQQAAHQGPAGLRGSRLRAAGAEPRADERLNRRPAARQPDASLRQARPPHRLEAAGTSP